MWENVIQAMHGSANLTRERIWAPLPPYIPTVRREFAMWPRPGFVGRDWRPGGWVLVGANPGSTEGRDPSIYAKGDATHIEFLRAFARAPSEPSFHNLMDYEQRDIVSWSLDWAISGTLERLGSAMDDVAILNVIPFSTKEAPPKTSPAWRNASSLHFARVLAALEPQGVVWLGKAAVDRTRPHLRLPRGTKSATVSRQRDLDMATRFRDLSRVLGSS